MDEAFIAHLRTKGIVKIGLNSLGVITNLTREGSCSLGYNDIELMWETWQAAQAVPEGFVLVSAEQMSQWGHMANYAEQYGCPECYEARGYAHSLACEINEFFAIEAQEPAND